MLHCRRRERKRSQRYTLDFVEDVSDIDPNFDSDDDIMGEAVYDEEYLRSRRQPKASTSEDDGEFRPGNGVDQVEYSLSSEDGEKGTGRSKRLPTRSPQATRLIAVDEIQIGIKRNKRSARPHMNHHQHGLSGTDTELGKPGKPSGSDPDACSDAAVNDVVTSTRSQDQEQRLLHIVKVHAPGRDNRGAERKFLHLNELAPFGGFAGAPVQS